jgi:CHAT domain-containing protein
VRQIFRSQTWRLDVVLSGANSFFNEDRIMRVGNMRRLLCSILRSFCANIARHALALALLVLPALTQAQERDPAQLAGEIARLEKAIADYEAVAASKPDPAKEMDHLLAMTRLATLYLLADRIPDSWPLSEKILARLEKLVGPDDPNLVAQLEAVAASYGLQRRYAEAEKLRKRAIAINERAFGPDSLQVALSLQGLANLFRLEDRYDEGLAFATRALAIADRKLPANDPKRAVFISEVANMHMSAKRYDMAEPFLKQALAIVENSKDGDANVTGMLTIQFLQNLGLSALMRDRHEEARQFIDRAIAISTKLFGPGHTVTGAMLQAQAMQLYQLDKTDEAEWLFKQALLISEKKGGLGADLADNYVGLGLIEFKRKNWRKAYDLLSKSSGIALALEKLDAGGDATAAIRRRVASNADTLLLNAVAAYRTAEQEADQANALRDAAFQMAQRAGRSLAASALAQMAARASAGEGELGKRVREKQDLANEWVSLDKRLEQTLTKPLTERDGATEQALRQRMKDITARLDAIDALLAKDFPDFLKVSDPEPLSIGEVQRLLRPREVMIFIAPRPNQSVVWAISANAAEWGLIPLGETEFAQEVAALRCGLDETAWEGNGGKACGDLTGRRSPGRLLPFDLARANRLYRSLFEPFAASTGDAHLLIVASGALATLPFDVLVTEPPATGLPSDAAGYAEAAWLTRRNPVSYLPSVSSLKALRVTARPSRADRPYFGIANPLLDGPDVRYAPLSQAARTNRTCAAINATTTQAVAMRGSFPKRAVPPAPLTNGLVQAGFLRIQVPLPETAEEICAVARGFSIGEADIRLADRATETEVKHLSASGELAKYRILHFATHAALAGQVSKTAEAGIILTPPQAGTVIDDGYLTASEISTLKLDADWVILSACNTAREGQAGAEALSGLARAFFYAQARALLASHWEVDSQATVMLITTASAALQREPHIGRAEAIRRAMLRLIDNGTGGTAHPRYWAPFILVGEGGRDLIQ